MMNKYINNILKKENAVFLLFILFYIYIFRFVNPLLYYQADESVFFLDFLFFKSFLSYPGGISAYIAAFLSQLFFYPWFGSLIITLLALLMSTMSVWIMKLIDKTIQSQILYMIPAILLIAVHSDYLHPLSISIALTISLLFFILYIKTRSQTFTGRIISFIILSMLVYYSTAANLFYFALLCVVYEICMHRKYVSGIIFVLVAFLIPFLIASQIFIINKNQTYFYLLPESNSYNTLVKIYNPPVLLYFLYAFFIFLILAIRFKNTLQVPRIASRINSVIGPAYIYPLKFFIIILLSILVIFFSINQNEKSYYQIDYYAKHKMWQGILEEVKGKSGIDHPIKNFHVNRALFHQGIMLSELFKYYRSPGTDGLLLNKEICGVIQLQNSDFFLELGLINEALHWINEAMTMYGETPSILRQLYIIYILKKEYGIAYKYLTKLSKTLVYNKQDKNCLHWIESNQLPVLESLFSEYRRNMAKKNFIYVKSDNEIVLKKMLESNINNKMAFEYLMSYYLLKGEISTIIHYLPYMSYLNYQYFPNHLEEGIILYMTSSKKNSGEIIDKKIMLRKNKLEEYYLLIKILQEYKNNKKLAQREIEQRFHDTYWYYLLYEKDLMYH